MYSQVYTGSLSGIEGELITVETDISFGMPNFIIVGLPGPSVKEAKDRLRSAISNSGFAFPARRITINLVPAHIRKEGTHFDLPIAAGILAAMENELVDDTLLGNYGFIGELSLDGSILPVRGALPLAAAMRSQGIKRIVAPEKNMLEVAMLQDVLFYSASHIREVADFLRGKETVLKKASIHQSDINSSSSPCKAYDGNLDFQQVQGQAAAKRAMQISAAGGHNIILTGPPGVGKTMLAQRLPTILPPLDLDEQLEVMKIYSITDGISPEVPFTVRRPFRSPHHSISKAALIGGGARPKPGEITMAHNGVLFLDEINEFKKDVLEMLRQPLEEEHIHITRAGERLVFPSSFILAAACNPCPCGYLGHASKPCKCSSHQIDQYKRKLSGPLIDRIDLQVELLPPQYGELAANSVRPGDMPTSSKELLIGVQQALNAQKERYKAEKVIRNSKLTPGLIKKYCVLENSAETLLEQGCKHYNMSGRAYQKILKIARTISDIEGVETIHSSHVAEAMGLSPACSGQTEQ